MSIVMECSINFVSFRFKLVKNVILTLLLFFIQAMQALLPGHDQSTSVRR